MEQNFIKGGIYTISNNEHNVYVLIKEGIINKVMFLNVRVSDLTYETVQREFDIIINEHNNNDIRENYLEIFDKTLFMKTCDGFLGIIDLQKSGRFK